MSVRPGRVAAFLSWPRFRDEYRASDATVGVAAYFLVTTTLAGAFCLPVVERATGLALRQYLLLWATHVALLVPYWTVPALARSRFYGLYAAAVVNALSCGAVFLTGKPDSILWATYFVFAAAIGNACGLNLAVLVMCFAGPLLTGAGLLIAGGALNSSALWVVLGLVSLLGVSLAGFVGAVREKHDALLAQSEARGRQLELETERVRLLRDIHDGVGSTMTSALMLLRVAQGQATGELETRLAHAENLLNEGLGELRDVLWTFDTEECSVGALALAMRERAQRHLSGTGIRSTLVEDLEAEDAPVSPSVLRAAPKLLQEALANVVKHARAGAVEIRLRQRAVRLELLVRDDGVGFDLAHAAARGHTGLRSMRRRCEELGGALHLESRPGAGTTVLVRLDSSPARPPPPESEP